MKDTRAFSFLFLNRACRVEIASELPEALRPFERFQALFPAFTDQAAAAAALSVRITDLARRPVSLESDDPVFERMRAYFRQHYPEIDDTTLAEICSPLRVPDPEARSWVVQALDEPQRFGLSAQRDFLVRSEREAGRLEALADVASSVREAWAFHVLNFFKVFFFADGVVRLHSSGATVGDRGLLMLANTGGGKSTMKNWFLERAPDALAFTDDSILARREKDGFRLYQDPVEFMRWAYLPEEKLSEHRIPSAREPLSTPATLFYLEPAETTNWWAVSADEIQTRINREAFYQRGFLTQRFVPPPDQQALLDRYFYTSLALLKSCSCFVAEVKRNDDYGGLFSHWRRALALED